MKEKSAALSAKTEKPKVGEYYFTCKFIWEIIMSVCASSWLIMSIPFDSAKSDKSVQNLLQVCSRLLLSPFYKLECASLSFIVTIHHDI